MTYDVSSYKCLIFGLQDSSDQNLTRILNPSIIFSKMLDDNIINAIYISNDFRIYKITSGTIKIEKISSKNSKYILVGIF